MLSNLFIENVAVIEKANIDFSKGFNVLTGETGAGKSIVIDSINAILGNRTSKQIIRTGAENAFVSATFHNVNDLVIKKARSLGFVVEDDCLILQRELSINGKNSCHINSRPASVSALKELGAYLVGIHGQNDNLELISPSLHMHYIDSLAKLSPVIKEYRDVYFRLKQVEEELDNKNLDEEKRLEEIDLLTYQINEIENADIQIGEQEKLVEEKKILNNAEKITKSLINAQNLLDGSDDIDFSILKSMDDVSSNLVSASNFFSDLEELSNRTANAYYELQDISSEISLKLDEIGLNPERLEEIEERLDLIYRLSRKYGPTEEDILIFLTQAKSHLKELEDYSTNMIELQKEYSMLLSDAKKEAQKISNIRRETAKVFVDDVQKEMAFLEMPNVKLVVSQNETELGPRGFDKIEFLFSVNPGEEPKPVSKIASGGELSRMMLAIKTVLAKDDFIETLIFDEIDTGISGGAAERVGQKLQQISNDKQVICVTHQAQIAALADNHLLIKKEYVDNKTYTLVEPLDYDGRVKELARIIDGIDIGNTALEHAKKLLKKGIEDK